MTKIGFGTVVIVAALSLFLSCSGGSGDSSSSNSTGSSANGAQRLSGVLMWKGDTSGRGSYSSETVLTPQNVNPRQFGKLAEHTVDGVIIAQPLFLSKVTMNDNKVHDVVIVATEHDSIYAFDATDPVAAPLWERHYAVGTATTVPDNFGGRTTLGGEVGITGTPVIDPSTGAMYFVTMLLNNGVAEQWLRAVDVRTGNDFGPGSVLIKASVPGDGVGSQNNTIAFDSSIENQRAGLVISNGAVLITWASFSDWGVYHGWLMTYSTSKLQQLAVLNLTPQFQPDDDAFGPADFGGGAGVWQGGAPPTIDAAGNVYLVAADGSFNANQGGKNFGDTVLKLRLTNSSIEVLDWFTPSNHPCVDAADLEIGSGGLVQLPGGALGLTVNKEGRVYLLNLDNLGKFNPSGDTQIPQQFLAGANACFEGVSPDHAEGTDWQRLYGNPSYWNGNLYLAPSNTTLRQYSFQNGLINTTPIAQSPSSTGLRGGHTVVSSNGNSNGIVWMYEKSANVRGILHAYDATNIGRELWNSNMNGNDGMGEGNSFGIPVVADGRIITTYEKALLIYGPLR